MRSQILAIALALSLLLNAGLIAGALFGLFAAERNRPDPEAHIAAVAERLELSRAETEGLRAFRQNTLDALAAQREGGGALRQELIEMLDDPRFDTAAVAQTLNAHARARNAVWAEVGGELHAWVRSLSPAQQAAFVEMAQEKSFFRKLFARPR